MGFKSWSYSSLFLFFLVISAVNFLAFICCNNSLEKSKIMAYTYSPPSPHMSQLDWSSMQSSYLKDVYTFISGYYDNRNQVPGRPSVVILAYIAQTFRKTEIRCLFTYANGTAQCLTNAVAKMEAVNCFAIPFKTRKADFKQILCPLPRNAEVPEFVQMSSSTDCRRESLSGKIKVRNMSTKNEKTPTKIGVCLHSSLREQGSSKLSTLRNFITMCRFLGAGFITMYASPSQVSMDTILYLRENYSDVVNLVEWKDLTFDYHGQYGIIHDCLHRHRYEAEYLAFIDLDEMILPLRHLNWSAMLDSLEQIAGNDYAAFSFMNRIYKRSKKSHVGLSRCTIIDEECMYLSYLDDKGCIFKNGHRSKLIVSTRHSVHVAIHKLCQLSGKKKLFLVNKNFAINAHYRTGFLRQCYSLYGTNTLNLLSPLLDKFVNETCK